MENEWSHLFLSWRGDRKKFRCSLCCWMEQKYFVQIWYQIPSNLEPFIVIISRWYLQYTSVSSVIWECSQKWWIDGTVKLWNCEIEAELPNFEKLKKTRLTPQFINKEYMKTVGKDFLTLLVNSTDDVKREVRQDIIDIIVNVLFVFIWRGHHTRKLVKLFEYVFVDDMIDILIQVSFFMLRITDTMSIKENKKNKKFGLKLKKAKKVFIGNSKTIKRTLRVSTLFSLWIFLTTKLSNFIFNSLQIFTTHKLWRTSYL